MPCLPPLQSTTPTPLPPTCECLRPQLPHLHCRLGLQRQALQSRPRALAESRERILRCCCACACIQTIILLNPPALLVELATKPSPLPQHTRTAFASGPSAGSLGRSGHGAPKSGDPCCFSGATYDTLEYCVLLVCVVSNAAKYYFILFFVNLMCPLSFKFLLRACGVRKFNEGSLISLSTNSTCFSLKLIYIYIYNI